MNIRRPYNASSWAGAAALAFLLCGPGFSAAIGLGEAELQSKLGEPLRMRVGLDLGGAEKVEESCLAVAVPDSGSDSMRYYFSRVHLAIKSEGTRQYVNISSSLPFDELFARVQLSVNCPGVSHISKTLTVLPDLESSPVQAIVPPAVPVAAAASAPAAMSVVAEAPRQAAEPPAAMPAEAVHTKVPGKAAPSATHRRAHRQRYAHADRDHPLAFRLKLSGEPIDESRIGKISPEQRELLLAQQKLLDADDETAKFLDLQHQVKQLQDELGLIRFKLEKMELGSVASPANGQARPDNPEIARATPGAPINVPAGIKPESRGTQPSLLTAAGLVLALLVLWLGLRYYSGRRSLQTVQTVIKEPGDDLEAPVINLPSMAIPAAEPPRVVAEPPARTPPIMVSEVAQPSMSIKSKEELAEDDSMLEEAELYAAHGHSNKAIEILREINAKNPTYTEAWVLLMSILSSLGKTEDFARSARDFLKFNPQSESWKMIQALGRTLDQQNPLYAGDKNLDVAARFLQQLALSKRRLVGDILVEMGALTEQDLLNCMAGYDPKRHGRFGGYLVSQKMITHAQLNEALLHQQGIGQDPATSSRLTLKDMDNFLSGFDPQRNESIGEYLVAQGMITQEQLNKVLQQKNPEAEPADTTSQLDKPVAGLSQDDVDHLWDLFPVRDKLSRTRAIDPASDTMKIARPGSHPGAVPPPPEIDFDIGSGTKDKPND